MAVTNNLSEIGLAKHFWIKFNRESIFALFTPFVISLASGNLKTDSFRHYIAQDVHFLRSFAKAYELAQECADDDDDKLGLSQLRKEVLEELKLHDSLVKYRNIAYHLTTYVLFEKSKQETKGNQKTETKLNKKEVFYMNESVVLDNPTLPTFPINGPDVSVFQMTRLVNKTVDCVVEKNIVRNRHEHGRLEFGLVISGTLKFSNTIFHSRKSLKVICYPLKFG
ncbi:unnamed protein product [Vicia faba]|uniref:Thiaminase-2/PQQC domain-containing protein n=1 Tax=Vicia faba TaxID=3906 RepID=A0AAV0YZU7_VICFA|nr:unnamed protein product [Vicia faba]